MANKKERRAAAKAAKAGAVPSGVAAPPVPDGVNLETGEAGLDGGALRESAGVGKDGKKLKAAKTTKSGLTALPKLPKARKPKPPKDCGCGCGLQTRGGRFLPGHDARLHGWALRISRGLDTTGITPGEEKAARAYLEAATKDAE